MADKNIKTGIVELDELLSGEGRLDLSVFSAGPGKTTLREQMIKKALEGGAVYVDFDFEMKPKFDEEALGVPPDKPIMP